MPNDDKLLMELAKKQMSKEMPREISDASISPMNLFDKLLMDGRQSSNAEGAYTSPFTNTIKYNPEIVRQLNQTGREDLLAHELVHIKQNNQSSVWNRLKEMLGIPEPYGQNPNELEAFQVERDRALKQKRLPSFMFPSFEPGAPTLQTDIELKKEKK